MIVVAVCPRCAVYRYRSRRDYKRGEPLNPGDFDAIPPQHAAVKGEKAVCVECGSDLTYRFDPPATDAPRHPGAQPADGTVTTLFEAAANEEVSSMREIAVDRLLVVTNRRIVIVNLEALLVGVNGHDPSA